MQSTSFSLTYKVIIWSAILLLTIAVIIFSLPKKYFFTNDKLQPAYSTCRRVSVIELDAWFRSSVKSFNYIPKIIHQSWKNETLRERQALWAQTWCNQYAGWLYHLWTDQENEDFIQNKFPWFYSTYISLAPAILRADSVRYLYLFYYGGIYVDLDYESIRRIDEILIDKHIVLSPINYRFEYSSHCVPNSWMASQPRHQFWIFLIHRIMNIWSRISNENERVNNWNGKPEFFTGPTALFHSLMFYLHVNQNTNASLNQMLGDTKLQQPDALLQVGDITFLGPKLVHANDWMANTNSNACWAESPTLDENECKRLQQPVYSITYWSHSYRPSHLNDSNYLRNTPKTYYTTQKENVVQNHSIIEKPAHLS